MQTGFSFSQPFLVKRVIEYIESNDATDGEVAGAGLIMSYLIVYVGIALATSVTQQWANYLVTRIRAGLIDLIYAQTLKIQCLAVDEADSLTLMSTDVERISTGLRTFREYTPFLLDHTFTSFLTICHPCR